MGSNAATDDERDAPRAEPAPAVSGALARAAVRFGATRMPRWWLRYSPGPIGGLVGFSRSIARAQVFDNQRLIHGTRPWLRETADVLATFANFGHSLAEALAVAHDRHAVRGWEVEHAERVERLTGGATSSVAQAASADVAREEPRGAVFVTAHVGSWDVAGLKLQDRGLRLGMVMAPEPDARAREMHDQARARQGVTIFHVGDDPLSGLPLVRHLRGGGIVAMQIDRTPPSMKSHPTTLFGAPWRVPLGPFQLAQLTGVPIVPIFTARIGFLEHLIHVDPWIELPRRATPEELDAAIQTAVRAMETFIARFPTQWFHFAPHPTRT